MLIKPPPRRVVFSWEKIAAVSSLQEPAATEKEEECSITFTKRRIPCIVKRKKSIIGDGGTVDVRRFEIETGRSLGRNGNTHQKKVEELINLINKSLQKEMSDRDRLYLEMELEKLKKVK